MPHLGEIFARRFPTRAAPPGSWPEAGSSTTTSQRETVAPLYLKSLADAILFPSIDCSNDDESMLIKMGGITIHQAGLSQHSSSTDGSGFIKRG
eukprot:6051126-Alexandrium_andersonii.AAC.1